MKEHTFQRISLIVLFLGFIALLLVYLLVPPKSLTSFSIPQDSLVEFDAQVISVSSLNSSASTISFSRNCVQTGFFDSKNASLIPLNSSVRLRGRVSGDVFIIESLTFLDR